MKTKNTFIAFAICTILSLLIKGEGWDGASCFAQNVGISATGVTPDNSAMLDVVSSNTGLLIPRVNLTSLTDAATILSPAPSLMVYNTNAALTGGTGYYYNAGTSGSPLWVKLLNTGAGTAAADAWLTKGNSGTTASNFIGTTDNVSLRVRTNNLQRMYIDSITGNVGIGTASPTEKLHVNGALVTQSGQVKRDFVTFNTTSVSSPAIPIHIKTNINWTGVMYRIVVEGYNEGTSRPIYSEVVGYTPTWAPLSIQNASVMNYAAGASISQYTSSDGFVVIKLSNATSFYYAGFSVSAWFTNPVGPFNISATIVQQAIDL